MRITVVRLVEPDLANTRLEVELDVLTVALESVGAEFAGAQLQSSHSATAIRCSSRDWLRNARWVVSGGFTWPRGTGGLLVEGRHHPR
jgi:hypothetical protein